METPKFYVRCSGIGEIMTNPRTKGDGNLSATCKTHLKKWLRQRQTGKRADIGGWQIEKGNTVESDGIVYASCHIPEMGLCCKNEKHYSDDWMQGTPDILTSNSIFDLKCSAEDHTFPAYEMDLPESDYAWQVLGYMALTGKRKSAVVYALMNMPEGMIERKCRFKYGQFYTRDQYEAFAANYQYDDLPPAMRLKKYPVEYDESKVQAIRDRVVECRNYIETVLWPAFIENQNQFTF